MDAAFTERRQWLLKLVVQEFTESAVPVASETLVRKYQLPISSATVRNEMGALEELGYLTQLHSSAGRIPTDTGYRFFVENLMDYAPLNQAEERTIRHQFYQIRGALDQWIHLSAAVLARATQNAAIITQPRSQKTHLKHLELISLHETTVLMVIVLLDGTVRQQTVSLEQARTQDELRRVSVIVTELCSGKSVADLEDWVMGPGIDPAVDRRFVRDIVELTARVMRQFEIESSDEIYSDGMIEMLSQPEFIPSLIKEEDAARAVERMRRALELLTSRKVLHSLLGRAMQSEGIHVIIGGEHGHDDLRTYSAVLSRYGVEGSAVGVIGIIGPTRMPYPRSISMVRYIADVMSDHLSTLYGGDMRSSPAALQDERRIDE